MKTLGYHFRPCASREYDIIGSIRNAKITLSPLTRGTLLHQHHYQDLFRFIPAGAGNTPRCLFKRSHKTVYPRWRGEHKLVDIRGNDRGGLSPLARGTHERTTVSLKTSRFIPAGAGNTTSYYQQRLNPPVYPRWRGEHEAMHKRLTTVYGLSPLARGTRIKVPVRLMPARFIPAGAGNTTGVRSRSR